MSCYHPAKLTPRTDYRTGEIIGYSYSPDGVYLDKAKGEFQIPCGKCIGCRLDYSRSWADRMMLELDHTKKGIFVTLTYSDEHLHLVERPDGFTVATLDKSDCQNFLKRLRNHFEFGSIRYFLAGEYGPKTHRPHYHVIIYGLSLSDFPDLVKVGENFVSQNYYYSPFFTDIWSNGFTSMSDVSWRTCAYVSRYVQKKAFKDDSWYDDNSEFILPEFSLMSRKPGIAGYYIEDHPDWFNSSSVVLSNPNDLDDLSKRIYFPKYILKNMPPELQFEFKQKRLDFMESKRIIELSKQDLPFEDYLKLQEQVKIAQIKRLKRGDV